MEKQKILVVDDSEFNRKILVNTLESDYDLIEAQNGLEALKIINKYTTSLSLILLDIMMPELNGIDVLRFLKENGIVSSIPVILITAADSHEEHALQLGAVDFITKPFEPKIVKARVNSHIELKNTREQLEALLVHNINKAEHDWITTMGVIVNAVEFKTLKKVKKYSKIRKVVSLLVDNLSMHKKFEDEFLLLDKNALSEAATIYNIGKIFVPDSLLFKKEDYLFEEELKIIRDHTINGKNLIELCMKDFSDDYKNMCQDACLYHHERWDGSGYPEGLKGDEIPLVARIITIVDVYDSLINKRPESNPISHAETVSHMEALKIISQKSGTDFDPEITEVFLDLENEIYKIYEK